VTLAFVDANVLAAPVPRSLLYMARTRVASQYRLTFSPLAELEAERHQLPEAIKVSELRQRLAWNQCVDVTEVKALGLIDTHPKDQAILAAAVSCGARVMSQDFPDGCVSGHC